MSFPLCCNLLIRLLRLHRSNIDNAVVDGDVFTVGLVFFSFDVAAAASSLLGSWRRMLDSPSSLQLEKYATLSLFNCYLHLSNAYVRNAGTRLDTGGRHESRAHVSGLTVH